MYVYHIPYISNKDEAHCLIHSMFSDKELLLVPLLRMFLIDIRHSYIDEDFSGYSNEEILAIAVSVFRVGAIKVQKIEKSRKMEVGIFLVESRFRRLKHFHKMLAYMSIQKEIILSTEIAYVSSVEGVSVDDINICHDGVERFLFSFSVDDDFDDLEYEGVNYDTILFEDGLPIPDQIKIEAPLMSEEQILDVFEQWAKMIGIDLTGKTMRMANDEDFLRRPFLEELADTIKQDPDHIFGIPSRYLLLSQSDIPPIDKLIEDLNDESPGTIACVIDDFKDDTMVNILNGIDSEKRKEVIDLLPQVPTLTFTERKRFVELFKYDITFVKQRMAWITKEFDNHFDLDNIKKIGTKREKDLLAEFEAWQYYIEKEKNE